MNKPNYWAATTRNLMKKYLGKDYCPKLTFCDKRKYGYRLKFSNFVPACGTHTIQEQLCKDLGVDYVHVAIQEVKPDVYSRYGDALVISVPFWSEDGSAESEWLNQFKG